MHPHEMTEADIITMRADQRRGERALAQRAEVADLLRRWDRAGRRAAEAREVLLEVGRMLEVWT